MEEHFAWYHVKEITNLSDVSALLMKEYGGGNHGDVTPGDERQQWSGYCDPIHSSHDPSYRFMSLPADHSYHVKHVSKLADEVGVSMWSCDQ